jgi:hypothetical protein
LGCDSRVDSVGGGVTSTRRGSARVNEKRVASGDGGGKSRKSERRWLSQKPRIKRHAYVLAVVAGTYTA